MFGRQPFVRWALFLVCAVAAVGVRADGVLDNVQRDAAGFIYVRDLKAADGKLVGIMAPFLGRNPILVTPGILLQALVGQDAGLESSGDILIEILSDDHPFDSPKLCIWLPVADYDKFTRKLNGKPDEAITVVTISGQDLLCARHGQWAVIVDPAQRARLEGLQADKPAAPPRLAELREWLNKQDMVVALFPTDATRRAFRDWVKARNVQPAAQSPATQGSPSDPFGAGQAPAVVDDGWLPQWRRAIEQILLNSPKLAALAIDADAAAFGIQVDETGNTTAGLRMASQAPSWRQIGAAAGSAIEGGAAKTLPALHRDGEFSVSASGYWPKALTAAMVDAAVRKSITEARNEPRHPKLNAQTVERFAQASDLAAQDVLGASAFHAPGGPQDGVYTNQFLALRVTSADTFVSHFSEAIQFWNQLSQRATPVLDLMFAGQPVTVGGKKGTKYSLDVAASVGGLDSHELRQTMERMFGPDRKLNVFVIPIDEQTVLLSEATAEQTAAALKLIGGAPPANWQAANVAAANQKLPSQADWRLFVSPSGYTKWLKQETDAVMGEVIGAPPTRQFPQVPPLGVAGGFGDGRLWVDAAVPLETLRASGAYLRKE